MQHLEGLAAPGREFGIAGDNQPGVITGGGDQLAVREGIGEDVIREAGLPQAQGVAAAAGCQLVASCDLALATDTATFCTPGVNIGLFCSTPMVAVSRNASPKQAMEMLLTGESIDASTAKSFGLINRIIPADYLEQVVQKYAEVIASKSRSHREYSLTS